MPESETIRTRSTHDEISLIENLQQHQWELRQQNEELRRTYVELNSMTERYRDLWNNAPVGYLSHLRNGTIVSANLRARQLLGTAQPYSEKSLIQSYLLPNSQHVLRQHLASLDVEGGGVSELQLATADSEPVEWLRIESSLVDGEYRSVLTDISAQKQAELERLQSQKMEVLHHLSAGIAHDFNNILQVISAYSQLLQPQLSDDNHRQLIDALLMGVQQGADLTERLMAFSRRSTLQTSATDLQTMVTGAAEIFRRTVEDNIEVLLKMAPEPVICHVDENQLQHALLNLCINSRDAMPDGGILTIELDDQTFEQPTEWDGTTIAAGEYAVITISDTGIGIDAQTISRIYEPFFTTKGSGSGTGLGLAIVKGIVSQHRGAIKVHSTRGKGTTISLCLPTCPAPASSKKDALEISADVRSECCGTILLAEDEPAIREAIGRMLTSVGFDVILAEDGQQAIDLFLAATHVDLILTDVMMPKCSGRALCERIRKFSPKTPFVFLTGHGDRIVDAEFLRSRNVRLLRKPIGYSDLLAAIGEQISHCSGLQIGSAS